MVGLSLNMNKCKVMSFYRARNKINYDYLIRNEHLLRVEQVEDLGFNLMPSLSFKYHIEIITCKALRTLGFIHRITSDLGC